MLNKDICFVIVFNHKYEENIEKLDKIYENRFSNIFYLMPFYEGNYPNVIPVYGSSYQFNGYFAQGFKTFYNEKFTHYVFIADDLILNPVVDQHNICDLLKINPESSYLKNPFALVNRNKCWEHILPAINVLRNTEGVEYRNSIPPYDEAIAIFTKHGINHERMTFKTKLMLLSCPKSIIYFLKYLYLDKLYKESKLPYPIVGGYSDFIVVSSESIKKFCHLCGVFASILNIGTFSD